MEVYEISGLKRQERRAPATGGSIVAGIVMVIVPFSALSWFATCSTLGNPTAEEPLKWLIAKDDEPEVDNRMNDDGDALRPRRDEKTGPFARATMNSNRASILPRLLRQLLRAEWLGVFLLSWSVTWAQATTSESTNPWFSEDETQQEKSLTPASIGGPFKRIRSARMKDKVDNAAGIFPFNSGKRARLNFFKGADFEAILTQVEHREGQWSATGQVQDVEGSLVLMSGSGNIVAGSVAVPGAGRFRFEGEAGGRVRLFELSDAVPRCGTCDRLPTGENPALRNGFTRQSLSPVLEPLTQQVAVVDLMIVYTVAAKQGAGGEEAIRVLGQLAVAEANAVYQNSRALTRLRLVDQREVAYEESSSFSTNLARLRLPDDGFLDEVHGWRQTNQADLVCLITEGGDIGFGGLASLMQEAKPESRTLGFSVVRRQNAVGDYVFVHEITHNFGCQHDRESSSGSDGLLIPGVFEYSFGRRFSAEGMIYRTVMAYPPGEVVPFLSTPAILFRGVPLGIPDTDLMSGADNVKTVNTTAPIVSAYFGEAVLSTVPSLAWRSPADGLVLSFGQKLKVEIEASDPDGSIERVEIYDGKTLAHVVSRPPSSVVSVELELAHPGAHEVFARAVDRVGADSGLVKRTIVVRPANDDFSKRTRLTGEGFSTRTSTAGSTRELGEPIHAGNQGAGSIWFEWTSPKSGTVKLTSEGDRHTEILDVYTGTILGSLFRPTRSVRFDATRRLCTVIWDVVAGQTYILAADGLPGTGESFSLSLEYHEPPVNDAFANRRKVEGESWTLSGSNEFASGEPGEPKHAGFSGGKSVWFDWEAPKSGSVLITCTGANVTWLVEAYLGTNLTSLTLAPGRFVSIDQERDVSSVVFNAEAGRRYALALDGSLGLSGNYEISLVYPPPPSNDAFAQSRLIGGTNVAFMDNSFAATSEPGEPLHAGTSSAKSLWYRWTAPVTGPVKILMTGQGFSVLPDAYQGEHLLGLRTVNRGIKVVPGTSSELTFQAVLGETYHIAADGFGGKGGEFSFSLVTSNQPAQLFGRATLGSTTTEFRFQISGSPGQRYAVESSTDLVSWAHVKSGSIGSEPEVFQDMVLSGKGMKFYRVLPLP
ncbi:MAG: hypothetical protein FJ404_07930 [Verrucomicrobia bacterium]|nr:hypothetical protein [Verrucomicrobiota bacterium]